MLALVEVKIEALQAILQLYNVDDIYNFNETSLFWKRSPSSGLASESWPRRKKDKTRISVRLCSNASGRDQLPVLFIGNAKTPIAMRGVNITAMGGQWDHNKSAWMDT